MFARGRDNNRGRDYATVHTDRRKNVRVRSLEGTVMRSVEKKCGNEKRIFCALRLIIFRSSSDTRAYAYYLGSIVDAFAHKTPEIVFEPIFL